MKSEQNIQANLNSHKLTIANLEQSSSAQESMFLVIDDEKARKIYGGRGARKRIATTKSSGSQA